MLRCRSRATAKYARFAGAGDRPPDATGRDEPAEDRRRPRAIVFREVGAEQHIVGIEAAVPGVLTVVGDIPARCPRDDRALPHPIRRRGEGRQVVATALRHRRRIHSSHIGQPHAACSDREDAASVPVDNRHKAFRGGRSSRRQRHGTGRGGARSPRRGAATPDSPTRRRRGRDRRGRSPRGRCCARPDRARRRPP